MKPHLETAPCSPLETELVELLARHGIDDKLIHEHLVRVRAVVALHEVSKLLGRPLNRDERKRSHVQYMDGRSVEQIVARLSQ